MKSKTKELKNEIDLFLEKEELKGGINRTKVVFLYFFVISFFYLIIGLVKLSNTVDYNIWGNMALRSTTFLMLITFIPSALDVNSGLKDKMESKIKSSKALDDFKISKKYFKKIFIKTKMFFYIFF